MTVKYRDEIDGLRAIAVCFVIAFHFFPTEVPRGYLGVDLFFVISGYVITAQLYVQLNDNRFSFRSFYARRIKRILPLAFFVILVVVLAGRLILLSPDFNRLSESAFAAATFWANIYYWLDGGYFSAADKLKPLLHMWSLSVEEQFYIFYPLVLWVTIGVLRMRLVATVGVLAVLSVGSLATFLYLESIGGSNPAFFLMPSRAWQFGLGALAALAVVGGAAFSVGWLAWSALAVLLASFFITTPIYFSELAVAGSTAIFLVVSIRLSSVVRALSWPVFKWLGLRSFSLYLWHWPIVVYLNYAFVDSTPLSAKLVGLVLCFGLAEMSYRFVETPFRYNFGLGRSASLIAASSCIVALVVVQANMREANGTNLSTRLAQQIQTNFRCSISDFIPYGASRACILRPLSETGNIAILGNSHSQMYAEAISARVEDEGTGVILIPLNACLPTVSLNISLKCLDQARVNLTELMADMRIATVVVGTTYTATNYVTEVDQPQPADGIYTRPNFGTASGQGESADPPIPLASALIDLADRIEKSGREVWLIGPVLGPGYDLSSELGRKLRFGQVTEEEAVELLSVPREEFDRRFIALISMLKDRLGERFLLPSDSLCDEGLCYFADRAGSYFADSNHLGIYGIATVNQIFDGL